MDLTSRLRSIVRDNRSGNAASGNAASGNATSGRPGSSDPGSSYLGVRRELFYEPDGGFQATLDLDRVADTLGGRTIETAFGRCVAIDRRYEADRWHGGIRIDDCEIADLGALTLLDPDVFGTGTVDRGSRRTIFLDLETTGLSGGAGTIAFLVGCGYFDLGAFQVRQFLLAAHAAERALLAAVAEFFEDAALIVTYNGKTFDLPVMETRWMFHRIPPPLEGVAHFDMLHPARRLWKSRSVVGRSVPASPFAAVDDPTCCRLSTLERLLFGVQRVGDVPGLEIPGRFFTFVRTGDPRPLEPVLEHNRLDLVSLAAVTARAAKLAREGYDACRDAAEALALGRVLERAGVADRAEACYRRALDAQALEIKGEALYRLGLRYRRDRRFDDAAAIWQDVLTLTARVRSNRTLLELRRFAAEALAIHLEHRRRDLPGARKHALFALDEGDARKADGVRHRLARIDRKLAKKKSPGFENPGLLLS